MNIDNKTAIRCKNRSYVQHQLIGKSVDYWFDTNRGDGDELHWLDVCCGRGVALEEVADYFSADAERRSRIHYYGYDLNADYLTEVNDLAGKTGIKAETHSGELADLRLVLNNHYPSLRFGAVTLVNVLHELPLHCVPYLLSDLLLFCDPSGFVFVFDIERIPFEEPEYGAIPWTHKEVGSVVSEFYGSLGYSGQVPIRPYGKNQNSISKQPAWHFELRPALLPVETWTRLTDDKQRDEVCNTVAVAIEKAFNQRLADIDKAIQRNARELRDVETGGTDSEIGLRELRKFVDMQLRDFWACYREVRSLRSGEAL